MIFTTMLLKKATALLFCVAVVFIEPSCLRFSYDVKLSGPVELTDQWLTLKPETPLKAERDLQMVVLDLELPFKYDFYGEGKGQNKGRGILMPDGEIVNPEIEVIDNLGTAHKLVYVGARRKFSPVYSIPETSQFPTDRQYKTVRIRSTRPIKCKAIYWFCESSKDWK